MFYIVCMILMVLSGLLVCYGLIGAEIAARMQEILIALEVLKNSVGIDLLAGLFK